jgi:hypothetical protein
MALGVLERPAWRAQADSYLAKARSEQERLLTIADEADR